MLFNNDNDRDNIITGDFWIAKVPTANWKSFWIVEDLGSSNFLGSSRSILSAKFTFGPSKTSRSSNYLESSMTIFPFKNNFEIYQNIRKTPSNSQTSPRSQADSSSGPPNHPELPHPPEYPKDIKRTFLERPDWFLDRLTVIKKESCTHLGKHWRCWSRCPAVAEASSSTTVRDHKLRWFHQVNAACKSWLQKEIFGLVVGWIG